MNYVFEIVEGPKAGQQIGLSGPVEIGRDPGAGIALVDDDLVSRRHARVTPDADGALVEDLDSRNGTFVDGDQIFSPAHLAVDGQLLVGTTLLQLRTEAAARAMTVVRAVPEGLTRPSPAPPPPAPSMPSPEPPRGNTGLVAAMMPESEEVVPALAVPESEPDYVSPEALRDGGTRGGVLSLLDERTKSKARLAPIGLFVLATFVVIIYFSLR